MSETGKEVQDTLKYILNGDPVEEQAEAEEATPNTEMKAVPAPPIDTKGTEMRPEEPLMNRLYIEMSHLEYQIGAGEVTDPAAVIQLLQKQRDHAIATINEIDEKYDEPEKITARIEIVKAK